MHTCQLDNTKIGSLQTTSTKIMIIMVHHIAPVFCINSFVTHWKTIWMDKCSQTGRNVLYFFQTDWGKINYQTVNHELWRLTKDFSKISFSSTRVCTFYSKDSDPIETPPHPPPSVADAFSWKYFNRKVASPIPKVQ